jgi:hypothetical protein
MAKLLGDGVEPLVESEFGIAFGSAACRARSTTSDDAPAGPAARQLVCWSTAPLPPELPTEAGALAREHDAESLTVDGESATLQSGISGSHPVYVDIGDEHAHFSSSLDALVHSRDSQVAPDWDGWAHIIGAGAPVNGLTTFSGIQRLGPWSQVVAGTGKPPRVVMNEWPWLAVEPRSAASVDAVFEALRAGIVNLADLGPITSLLSGGWDSRLLAALACQATGAISAWTTSSDTGHVLEQVVAAKVADQLGVDHTIVPPRWDEFDVDLAHFAEAVDFQTSFHVWAAPLARRLRGTGGTIVDGLGGGIFVGGAFPDTGVPRHQRLTHYLDEAEAVLHPAAAAQVRERTWAALKGSVVQYADHPHGATFTAYLTRTIPGISLSPFSMFARAAPAAAPFLGDEVVRSALAIPPSDHARGRLYPILMAKVNPGLAQLPTAADVAPAHREHPRRVSSIEAATVLRTLVTGSPVRQLLAPGLATADVQSWQRLLDRTKTQHLLRGLAVLALWLDRYSDALTDADPAVLLEPTG